MTGLGCLRRGRERKFYMMRYVHPQARKRGLARSWHPDLRLAASKTVRKELSAVEAI